ncbi:MAG: hypothetical protein GX868_05720 [Actinobacteria bacterium]|nr:hypothetical protein [Actinomycetota bacterium]
MNSDFADFGRLLAWASRAKEHPGRHEDYHRLVTLYLSDEEFAAAKAKVLAG